EEAALKPGRRAEKSAAASALNSSLLEADGVYVPRAMKICRDACFVGQTKLLEHPRGSMVFRFDQADDAGEAKLARLNLHDRGRAFRRVALAPRVGQESIAQVGLVHVVEIFEAAE